MQLLRVTAACWLRLLLQLLLLLLLLAAWLRLMPLLLFSQPNIVPLYDATDTNHGFLCLKVCGSDGVTYPNLKALIVQSCLKDKRVEPMYNGPCKGQCWRARACVCGV